jgi:hypothetical protein
MMNPESASADRRLYRPQSEGKLTPMHRGSVQINISNALEKNLLSLVKLWFI